MRGDERKGKHPLQLKVGSGKSFIVEGGKWKVNFVQKGGEEKGEEREGEYFHI